VRAPVVPPELVPRELLDACAGARQFAELCERFGLIDSPAPAPWEPHELARDEDDPFILPE
jgi:hypothetical protein